MPIRTHPFTVSLLLLAMLGGGTGHAAETLDQATRRIEAGGARVLSAERIQRGGREVYRFKLLTPKGRVRKVWVDPRSGPRKH